MAFFSTSTNVTLENGVLRASCQTRKGSWRSSNLNLNDFIGNDNGRFDLFGSNFRGSASKIRIEGSTLHASLRNKKGISSPTHIDLNAFVENVDGELTFRRPNERIVFSCSMMFLKGSKLRGLCMGADGLLRESTIDLNNHYANKNGSFVSGDRAFYSSSRRESLTVTADGKALLRAELSNYNKVYVAAEVDLAICVVNKRGQFVFEKHDGWFDRDGAITKFFEVVPFVGFIVAGLHLLAGNDEWAKRATALCANSSIVCVGIMVGAACGGPLGAAIGAGIMTPVGILTESAIKNTIKDPILRAQFEEATVGRFIYETLRNMLAAGAAGVFAEMVGGMSQAAFKAAAVEISKTFKNMGIAAPVDIASYALLKKLADALIKGQIPKEWVEAEKQVKLLM